MANIEEDMIIPEKTSNSGELNTAVPEWDIKKKNSKSSDEKEYDQVRDSFEESQMTPPQSDAPLSEEESAAKSPTSTKTLSFSIDRMLNLSPKCNAGKTEQTRTSKVIPALSPPSHGPVVLSSNVVEKTEDVSRKEKKLLGCSVEKSDCVGEDCEVDSNEEDENDENSRLAPAQYFPGSANIPDFARGDLIPMGLNARPMWPSLFSYLGHQWPETSRDRYGLIRRVGHPYQNRTPPKRKKPRTAFTRQQVMELEKRFSRQKYLASAERSTLAKGLNMSDSQVKTWFQNRRTKWRRQTAEEREMERQAAKKFLLSIQREEAQPLYSPLCAAPSSSHIHPGISRAMDVRYVEQS